MDLFSPDVIAATEERLVQESLIEACPNAWESVEAELQQPLPFSEVRGGACEYDPPASALLAGRRPGSTRRKEISDVPEDVARLSDAALARRLYWVWQHRGRGAGGEGLSEHDAAIQAEWTEARAAGFGLLRELVIAPSHRFVELAGGDRRAFTRRMVLQLLMVLDALGWNGFCLSAAQAEDLGYGSPAAWWRSIAWLEQRGLLVRLRRYKPGTGGRPVDLEKNWYGPGPKLLELREVYLAALGADPEGSKALEEFDAERERRRRRKAGQNRRRRHAHRSTYEGRKVSPAWQESWDESRPRWAEVLVEEAGAQRREAADAERARHILATGDLSSLGEYQDPLPLAPDQALQLEAALGGEPYEGAQPTADVSARDPRFGNEASTQGSIGISDRDGNPYGVGNLNQEEGEISSPSKNPLSLQQNHQLPQPEPSTFEGPPQSPPPDRNDASASSAPVTSASPAAALPSPDIPGREPESPPQSGQGASSCFESAQGPPSESSSVRRDAAEEILRMVGEISDQRFAQVLKAAAKQWLQ